MNWQAIAVGGSFIVWGLVAAYLLFSRTPDERRDEMEDRLP